MSAKVDGNEILARLAAAKKNDRNKVTLYLSKSLYEDFRDVCADIPVSTVIEELMKEFVQSLKKQVKAKEMR